MKRSYIIKVFNSKKTTRSRDDGLCGKIFSADSDEEAEKERLSYVESNRRARRVALYRYTDQDREIKASPFGG